MHGMAITAASLLTDRQVLVNLTQWSDMARIKYFIFNLGNSAYFLWGDLQSYFKKWGNKQIVWGPNFDDGNL
jgi:hypothetical protein